MICWEVPDLGCVCERERERESKGAVVVARRYGCKECI